MAVCAARSASISAGEGAAAVGAVKRGAVKLGLPLAPPPARRPLTEGRWKLARPSPLEPKGSMSTSPISVWGAPSDEGDEEGAGPPNRLVRGASLP